MRKCKLKYRNYVRTISIVILMSFLKYPASAEPLTEQRTNLTENSMRYYSDLEIDLLIDEITVAAREAIEQAAAEAARAASLAMLEREAAAVREAAEQRAEAQRWQKQAEINLQQIVQTRREGRKNTILGVLIGILGGLALGVSGALMIGN